MIKVDCNTFSNAFAVVAAAVPSRTTKDVVKNVLLVCDGSLMTLSATDTEVHMRTEIPYEGEKESCLLPAAKMLAILREVDAETLTIKIKDERIQVKCGTSEFNFGSEPIADFPPVPTFNADAYVVANSMSVADAIQKTIFSTDEKSARYALGGISMEIGGEILTFTSTDSRRLSTIDIACTKVNDPNFDGNTNPIIPIDAMKLLSKSLESGNDLWIAVTPNSASFKVGPTSITSQLVQGRFPDYRKVVPSASDIKIPLTVPVGQFARLLRQVRVMETAESKGVEFVFAKGLLKVESDANESGKAHAEMPIAYDGETIKMVLSGEYISAFLKCLDQVGSVDIGLISVDDRVLFTSGNYRHVIMPIAK